jgi:uncharacterized protein with PIN domain
MFGTLAKWLRLCGFDTFYKNEELSDTDILRIATDEKRMILSRDRDLIRRAEKKRIPSCFIESRNVTAQLIEMLSKTGLTINDEKLLTRCSVCNTPLKKVDKQSIIEKIPDRIVESKHSFQQCISCKRIYWKGTHYEKIQETIAKIQNEVS